MIGRLFDFKKTELRCEDELIRMSARFIKMVLVAFPELQCLNKVEIARGFLENVGKNQKWEGNQREDHEDSYTESF